MTEFLQAETPKILLVAFFDVHGFGPFFSVGFVFTRTTPIFGLCGVWTTPSAQAAAIINLAVVAADGADLKPQRQKIGVVLVKTKTTEKKISQIYQKLWPKCQL